MHLTDNTILITGETKASVARSPPLPANFVLLWAAREALDISGEFLRRERLQ